MDENSLYNTIIVNRSRAPLHAGVVERATRLGQGTNPLCGDRVRLSVRTEKEEIENLLHETRGCAICIASTDLMAEAVTGRTVADALDLARQFTDMLENGSSMVETADAAMPDALRAFLPLRTHRSRLRCATLPWTALEEALDHD
ncbi:Fe-S cluster assembly sulfur transfer protein SufU [Acetobacter oeni]|uniref:Iron-sulfur cluster assembly scaffold protein n=1 Tax=Acetobacter oeni TaxID=304077 RepID=A0A511XJP8_9PROT|nr:SUF system NifU family Fe-S cluster assembly protein [Acetobacter oeni]MBB3883376.1 nitrogen fixation NifU-like protein [Acetobacter oeni]NHO19456.1 SUF system NifU family Fe-S cluster assembly protein [Acetobacter oeni]GEN63159.1 iron-sulfur cluster assembly scaffold protein [Acetobacter oeni]